MLKQKHAGHGLSLIVDGSINRRSSLSDMSTRLRAAPQFDRQGQRFGTFEVWRRGVREVPIPLQYRETHGAIGAGTSAPTIDSIRDAYGMRPGDDFGRGRCGKRAGASAVFLRPRAWIHSRLVSRRTARD